MNVFTRIAPLALLPFLVSAEELKVDKDHSEVQFSVSHMVISKTKGEFTEFDATVVVEDDELVSVNAEIPVSSIDTGVKKRDEHLRSADFFNVEKYPTMTFESTKIEGGKLHGKLTIMDTTKEVALDLEFLGPVKDPWGNTRYGLNLSGEIDRTEFGLTWNAALETGGVVVGETVSMVISVELMK
ncbi:MAG: YceI family protein [Kiritimatiellae bacterium]|jgi:polyisoprenoid-binding protein YceI|nr:YceI family protein [Kiritimatiellia bacterium]